MEITSLEKEGIDVIQIKGNLDTGTAPNVEVKVYELIDSGIKKLVFDLSETGFVSSAGLRVFLAATKKLSAKKGKVALANPNEVVKEILDISGFTIILDVHASLDEALSSLK